MISPRTRQRILRRDKFSCRLCGASAPEQRIEIDHKTPKSLGGTDSEDNLWVLCVKCNRGKGNVWDDGVPMCEVCGDNRAVSFSAFIDDYAAPCNWRLTCNCTSEEEDYYVYLDLFKKEPMNGIFFKL